MSHPGRPVIVILGLIIAALAVVSGVIAYAVHNRRIPAPVATSLPANPTTQPLPATTNPARAATKPPDAPKFPLSYLDVICAAYPSLPTTQPIAVPLELGQAARFVLKDPIYLDRIRGGLWITRPDAAPIKQVLHDAADPDAGDGQSHVLRERVVFVHWMPTDSGAFLPYLVCADDRGRLEVVSASGRKPLPADRNFDWSRAFSWNEKVVAPSRSGISVFHFHAEISESYHDLSGGPGDATSTRSAPTATAPATAPAEPAAPQALEDAEDGLLAWIPWEHGMTGSRGAARYRDGKWTDLGPEQGWPEKIVELVPLRDGSMFQFVAHDNGSITVQTAAPAGEPVDAAAIEKLVEQLSDPDPDVRRKAFADLSNFGPGAWPTMAKLEPDQSPQGKLLLRQLLKDRNHPTLSGMTLLGDRSLQLAARLSDGGVVFYAARGVSIPRPDGDEDPDVTAPAWLSVRPGHYIELLPPALITDLKPEQAQLDVAGDQWIVNSDVRGPRLFYGNGFATMLRKAERQFSRIVGIDQRGRWLFRRPDDKATSRPATAASANSNVETLVIDPHLPDPVPRLPVWQLAIADAVGWDKDNWPAVQNGTAYALTESDWRPLDKDEKIITKLETPSTTISPAASTSAAPSSTKPATVPVDPSHIDYGSEAPLLIAPDGTRYFGGLTDLRIVGPGGEQTTWPLPAIANGSGPAHLVQTKEGKLFLFNQPGRVLRIGRVTTGNGSYQLEATFTHDIPTVTNPTRIWLDPADRIDIAWGSRLAILFPQGYIPRAISEKMVEQTGLDADSP